MGLVLAHVLLVETAHGRTGSVPAVGIRAGVRSVSGSRVGSGVGSTQLDDGRVAVELAVVVVPGHVDVTAGAPAASPAVLDGNLLAVVSGRGREELVAVVSGRGRGLVAVVSGRGEGGG